MKAKVIGIKQITTKSGNVGTNLYVSVPFSEYDSKNAIHCIGEKVDSYYTGVNCEGLKAGDVINLDFEPGFEGKAQLVGVHLAK